MAQRFNVDPRYTDLARWVRGSAEAINSVFREISDARDGIEAGAPQTQAGATELSLGINRISSSNTNDGVKLPFSSGGGECIIRNDSGATIKVWPQSGAKINGGANDAADTSSITTGSARCYRAISSTEWITVGNT